MRVNTRSKAGCDVSQASSDHTDAAAYSYADAVIDQAYRAVNENPTKA
ncbi:hypothetical protein L0244_30010 [bacterium]|nr:hypothetical protein [bacterium]